MKIWVYSIDWRTRAVNILAEVVNEAEANKKIASFMLSMSDEDRVEFVRFHTLASTAVSREMEEASLRFCHKGEKVAG
jgi:hypothetical protein